MKKKSLLKPRECGACTACCTALGVPELEKKMFTRCDKLSCTKGCGIYNDRPQSCRDFECLWLQGLFEGEHRPDRLGLVLSVNHPSDGPQAVLAYEVSPGTSENVFARMLVEKLCKFAVVIVVTTEVRRLMGPPDLVRQYMEAAHAMRKSG